MDNIKYDLLESYKKYFNALNNYGYINPSMTNKLLIYSMIEELINGSYYTLITDKDYRSIVNSLYCIYGSSCLFEFPNRINHLSEKVRAYYPKYVADEFSILLGSELQEVPISAE